LSKESVASSSKKPKLQSITVALKKNAGLDKAVRTGYRTFLINDNKPSSTRSSTNKKGTSRNPSITYNSNTPARSRMYARALPQPAEEVQVVYQARRRPPNLRRLPPKTTNWKRVYVAFKNLTSILNSSFTPSKVSLSNLKDFQVWNLCSENSYFVNQDVFFVLNFFFWNSESFVFVYLKYNSCLKISH
jgi:hypothetical protein